MKLMDNLGFTAENSQCQPAASNGKIILPQKEGKTFIENIHLLSHLGAKHLQTLVKASTFYVLRLSDVAEAVVKKFVLCAMTNVGHSRYPPGRRLQGDHSGVYWKVDFTEVKPAKYGNKYLLGFFLIFKILLRIFLNFISNAIPKVPHTLPPHFPTHPFPIFWPWHSPVLGNIKFMCPMGLSFQ